MVINCFMVLGPQRPCGFRQPCWYSGRECWLILASIPPLNRDSRELSAARLTFPVILTSVPGWLNTCFLWGVYFVDAVIKLVLCLGELVLAITAT